MVEELKMKNKHIKQGGKDVNGVRPKGKEKAPFTYTESSFGGA